MRLERATDAKFINAVANHPAVKPYMLLRRGENMDYSGIVSDPRNVVLTGEYGGMAFHNLLPGLFEVHTQSLPEGRGAWTLEMAHSALLYMFSKTEAVEIFTRVPYENEPAKKLTLAMGGVFEQSAEVDLDGRLIGWSIYRLTMQDWIKTSPLLEGIGQMFHVKLHDQYDALDLAIARHEDDAWHNRNVGAAHSMIAGGQAYKGVGFYNRWARMALAPMIGIIGKDPLVIDIQDCWLKIAGDGFKVMEKPKCRVE